MDFQNELTPGTIQSDDLTYNEHIISIKDDENGNMLLYIDDVLDANIGTIDYHLGLIELKGFIQNIDDNQVIEIYGEPTKRNVISGQNLLILFKEANVSLTTI